MYLDSDALVAYALVRSLLTESIDEALAALKQLDAKSQLQELCSRLDNPMPEYRVTDEGPDHAKTFYAAVYIGNDWMGAGSGRSKKLPKNKPHSRLLQLFKIVDQNQLTN